MLRPRVVVSRCLGFDRCRYDGSVIQDAIVESLRPWVEFIPVCPEVELGLGVPRSPVRLVRVEGEVRLLQPGTGRDLTEAFQSFANRFLASLPPVEGFLLKHRSPSCGRQDARVYASVEKSPSVGVGPGMFGQAIRERFPDLPIEDEGRLTNRAIREHFFTIIFALARLRETLQTGQMGALVQFHTEHKFLLMAYNQARLRELGRWVANLDRQPTEQVMQRYAAGFRAALSRLPRRPSVVNVLMHSLGFVSHGLSSAEKAYFLDLLAAYRNGQIPLSTPLGVMRAWVIRFDQAYLAAQTFFSPFPEALISQQDSGKRER